MARQDMKPEDRDSRPLELPATVDCPYCSELTDVVFVAPEGVYELEDLIEQPVMKVEGYCGHSWDARYEGWSIHEEA